MQRSGKATFYRDLQRIRKMNDISKLPSESV